MNVLHINTQSDGGAFNGAYRLHLALMNAGVNSKMLVRDLIAGPSYKQVFEYRTNETSRNLFRKVLRRTGWIKTSKQRIASLQQGKKGQYEVISYPFSDFDLTKSAFYQEADIINLHWVGNYLDYTTFFKRNSKPIVFTIRDSYPLLGIFHLNNDLERNRHVFGALDAEMQGVKTAAIRHTKVRMVGVGISNWMAERARASEFFKNRKVMTIHNCIDTNQFRPIAKSEARARLQIPDDMIVFSFVADGATRLNKGYLELVDAIRRLDASRLIFLTVGSGLTPDDRIGMNHRHIGRLTPEELSVVYSASDAFIFPTKEEALGNVMLEAMACGTPVVGTPVGGLMDVIRPNFNGLFSADTTSEGLKLAIEEFIQKVDVFDRGKIRDFIVDNFSETRIAKAYLNVYEELISNSRGR